MDELEAMTLIAEKLENLTADERSRVVAWTMAKYGSGQATPTVAHAPAPERVQVGRRPASKRASKTRVGKKAKSTIAMDKSLNLSPSGKKSASEFAAEKAPANALQKGVVAVYYLRDFVGMDKVSVSAVHTMFKTLGWPLPADLRNKLQQAGSKGWLDTSDGEDIKLTSMGENLIEHQLPPKKL